MEGRLHEYCNHGNYIEFIYQDGENITDIHDNIFFKMLNNMKNQGYSVFQKHYKELVYRNMKYENNEKSQVKIYKTSVTKQDDLSNGIKVIVQIKEKLPYHVFPSTTMLHSVAYVSKVIMKVNNRIYVNFEKRRYENQDKASNVSFNKIYINYNHDDNVDIVNMEKVLNTCIKQLVS
jgi:L-rhamnose mutarotase